MTVRLTEVQRKVVEHGDGPLLVVAGPGSGKTRVLTERVRHLLQIDAGHYRILAVTFTNKAANEMRERLQDVSDITQRAFIGTLHSFCIEVLANRGKSVGIDHLPTVFESYEDRKRILLRAIIGDHALRQQLNPPQNQKELNKWLSGMLDVIDDAKIQLIMPEMMDDDLTRITYQAYNDELRACDALDFGDLLFLTYRVFQERPLIADFYRRQYRYTCVDEAQDLNEAQYQVIRALCGQEYRNVMMVGDPRQAIFVWNGADPKYLDMFRDNFDAQVIELHENFRCSKAVLAAAQLLDDTYTMSGVLPLEGEVKLIVAEDETDEAVRVLDYFAYLFANGHEDIEGNISFEQCAILARNRYVLSAIEKELKERKWPYYKHLSVQRDCESGLIDDFILLLRILANPRDALHRSIIAHRWRCELPQVSDDTQQFLTDLQDSQLGDATTAVVIAAKAMGYSENDFDIGPALTSLEKYASGVESEEERLLIMEDIGVWRRHWESFLRSQPGGQHHLPLFLSQVAMGTTLQPKQEGIVLLTVHSAKGLEFDVVAIIGMVEGTFPDYRATGAALQEEKRNAFVAVTRSRRLLLLSYPKQKRMPWGDIKAQLPSRFLQVMELAYSTVHQYR